MADDNQQQQQQQQQQQTQQTQPQTQQTQQDEAKRVVVQSSADEGLAKVSELLTGIKDTLSALPESVADSIKESTPPPPPPPAKQTETNPPPAKQPTGTGGQQPTNTGRKQTFAEKWFGIEPS